MDNSLLAVRDINHKYIVVERRFIDEIKEVSSNRNGGYYGIFFDSMRRFRW